MKKSPTNYRLLAWSIVAMLLIWITCTPLPESSDHFRPAADFEEQESIMLSWNKKYQNILLPLTAIIAKDDHVMLFFNENKNRKSDIEIALLNTRVNIENVTLIPFKLEKDNIWIRD